MENLPDMSQLMKLASSPAGQKLISLLQQTGGDTLQKAVNQASLGNYEDAKAMLSGMLSSPQAQALLKQLEEQA